MATKRNTLAIPTTTKLLGTTIEDSSRAFGSSLLGASSKEGRALGTTLGKPDGLIDGFVLGVAEGEFEGAPVGATLEMPERSPEGLREGDAEGISEGARDGKVIGARDGKKLGIWVGSIVGTVEGELDGSGDGTNDGLLDGNFVGTWDAAKVEYNVGKLEGLSLRAKLGAPVLLLFDFLEALERRSLEPFFEAFLASRRGLWSWWTTP